MEPSSSSCDSTPTKSPPNTQTVVVPISPGKAAQKVEFEALFKYWSRKNISNIPSRKIFDAVLSKLLIAHYSSCPSATHGHVCVLSLNQCYLRFNFNLLPILHCEMRQIVVDDRLFELLYDCHIQTNHGKASVMHSQLNMVFYGITEKIVKMFLSTCKDCGSINGGHDSASNESGTVEGRNSTTVIPNDPAPSNDHVECSFEENFIQEVNESDQIDDNFNFKEYADLRKQFLEYCQKSSSDSNIYYPNC